MKNFSLFTLTLIIFIFSSCKPSQKKALKYNDEIVEEHFEILKLEYELINNIFYTEDDFEVESFIADYQLKLTARLSKLEKMKSFDKEDELRKSLIQLIKSMIEISENEYTELAKLLIESSEEDFENEVVAAKLTELTKKIDQKSDQANNAFMDAQSKFANKYDLTLR